MSDSQPNAIADCSVLSVTDQRLSDVMFCLLPRPSGVGHR